MSRPRSLGTSCIDADVVIGVDVIVDVVIK
jgi:hypothetical protein